MSTTIDEKLNDDIIAKKLLGSLHANLAPLNVFSMDYSTEAQKEGATITVPLLGGLTASDKRNAYEEATGNMGSVQIKLDHYARATVDLSDEQYANCSVATLEGWADEMANAVAEKVIKDMFSLIAPSNYPSSVPTTPGMTISKLIKGARKVMNKNKVPLRGRSYFPSVDAYDLLGDDPAIKVSSALHYGGTEYVREGQVPRYLGFNIFESTIIPESAPNGFCVHPAAIAGATRPLLPTKREAYVESRVIKDKATGIALHFRRHYGTGVGKEFMSVECVYGFTVGRPEGIVIMPEIPAAVEPAAVTVNSVEPPPADAGEGKTAEGKTPPADTGEGKAAEGKSAAK